MDWDHNETQSRPGEKQARKVKLKETWRGVAKLRKCARCAQDKQGSA